MAATALIFYVNGKKIEDAEVDPEWTLAKYIREKLGLFGTKLACEEGACGSCTVVLAKYNTLVQKPQYIAVNACLVPIFLVHGCAITTVEGLGSVQNGLHPIQERLTKGHGSQCGFCTPGFVMAFYALIRNVPEPTPQQIEIALEGNLCRCTGYRPILESFYSFGPGCGAKDCCKNRKGGAEAAACKEPALGELTDWASCAAYNPSQDPIFPPDLQLNAGYQGTSLTLTGPRVKVYLPSSQDELLRTLADNPGAQLVAAGTLTGLIERGGNSPHSVWVSTARVSDWKAAKLTENGLEIGASRTIASVQRALERAVDQTTTEHSAFYRGFLNAFQRLGSVQLRNVASWVGNLVGGSPVSDITVPFLAAGCRVCCVSTEGQKRCFTVSQDTFPGQRGKKFALVANELVHKAVIPASEKSEFFQTYKQTLRRGRDSALSNAAFYVKFDLLLRVVDMRLAFGGMANRPLLASETAAALIGKKWDESLLQTAIKSLADEIKLSSDSPGGRVEYRNSLALTSFLRFYTETGLWLRKHHADMQQTVDESCLPTDFDSPMHPTQIFDKVTTDQEELDAIGRPITHMYGDRHTTGEAQYIADMTAENMVHLALVQSTRPRAKILSIDYSEAIKLPGVVAYADIRDIPPGGTNTPGPKTELILPDDKTVFADKVVTSEGQTIAAIAATDVTIARRAAQLVKVDYKDLESVITIEDAIKADSFLGPPLTAKKGEPEKVMPDSELTLEGEIVLGCQDHVYMETQCALVRPLECGEWEVWTSSQSLSFAQEFVGRILGIPTHKIAVRAKRLGGAFGGKGFQFTVALHPAVVMANKLRRPVKCYLSRKEDMLATGRRHPFMAKYKVGFTKEGKLQALEMDLYSNAGDSVDSSVMVTFIATSNMDSVYNIPAGKVVGRVAKTNIQSNTSMRGAGQPQCSFIMDAVVDRIAQHLGKYPETIRTMNFSEDGYIKLGGDHVIKEMLRQCWDKCMEWSDFEAKKKEIQQFNKEHKYRKRGISMVPTRWGMGHGGFFEQGSALVHVYSDGTVLVSHGGVEMGQGVNTKCLQIASRALNLPIEKITIIDADTSKVPNAVPTGGSQGSDVFGLAVKEACEVLKARLEPVMKENPKSSWEDVVKAAWMNRVCLSVVGFGKPGRDGIPAHGCRYSTSGAAMTLVEIDCLTGDHQILATDIVMDVGDSMNPAIDIGQIEGAYLQSVGLHTTEEILYWPDGRLMTNSVNATKVPTVRTVPRDFRVLLLSDVPDTGNLYRSKGIGEPPSILGMGVYFAINEAIKAARAQNGLEPLVHPPSPLTVDRIRMACEDEYTKLSASITKF